MRGMRKRAGAVNHPARLFNLVSLPNVDYLTACLLHIEFPGIRKCGVKAMQSGYYYTSIDRAFTVQEFARVFGLDAERVPGFCEYHGLGFEGGGIMIGRKKGVDETGMWNW
jgi:hypothetical protein